MAPDERVSAQTLDPGPPHRAVFRTTPASDRSFDRMCPCAGAVADSPRIPTRAFVFSRPPKRPGELGSREIVAGWRIHICFPRRCPYHTKREREGPSSSGIIAACYSIMPGGEAESQTAKNSVSDKEDTWQRPVSVLMAREAVSRVDSVVGFEVELAIGVLRAALWVRHIHERVSTSKLFAFHAGWSWPAGLLACQLLVFVVWCVVRGCDARQSQVTTPPCDCKRRDARHVRTVRARV